MNSDRETAVASRPSTAAPVRHQLATWVRGGTSKCWIFQASQLPADVEQIEGLLVRAFGSPDARQIDGVGGGSSTTSKAIVIDDESGTGPVDYRFAQVSIDTPSVEWASNCGNCATGLALFVLHSGLRPPTGESTQVVLRNTVTGLTLTCEVPTPNGIAPEYGDRTLHGQHYPGVPVDVVFDESTWSTFGVQLPTGRAVDQLRIAGRDYEATLIDAGAPAALFDIAGFAGPDLDAAVGHLVANAHSFRSAAARLMGVPDHLSSIPKVGIVSAAPSGPNGLTARMVSMTALHPAIGLTSAVAIGAALAVPHSVPRRYATIPASGGPQEFTLHLPTSTTTFQLDAHGGCSVRFQRTARVLSEARIHIPTA